MASLEGPACVKCEQQGCRCDFQPSTAAGEYNDRWCRKCKSSDHFTKDCNVKHTHCCYDCCQPGIGQWLLDCQDHLICTSCCTKRASNEALHPKNYCKCQPIWIFVDNSNIWIAAKSYISTSKGLEVQDPRIRINYGNLINVIAEGRTIAKCFLFGSDYKPSTADTVWQKGVDDGFKVIIDEKGESRKEKKVDVRLCVGALTTVHKQKTKGTIVLATGDADFIPLVEKILDDGWKVEVISWEHALSNDYRHLEEDYKCCFKLRYLNEHAETVTFTESNPPDTYSNPIGATTVEIDEDKFLIDADEKSCKDWCDKVGCHTPCLFQYLRISERELTLIYPIRYHEDFIKAINSNKIELGIKLFQIPKKVIGCKYYKNSQCRHIEPKDCNYAHGNEDASCLLCENHHFTHKHEMKLDDT